MSNTGEVDIYGLLAELMRLALVMGLARVAMGVSKPSAPLLSAIIQKSSGNDLTALEKRPTISNKEPVRLPLHLRRQRDKYIRRWTEAMFQPE